MNEILPWDCEVFLRWWGSEGEMWRLDCKRAMERAKGEKASRRGFEKRRRFGSPRGMGLPSVVLQLQQQLVMFVVAGEEAECCWCLVVKETRREEGFLSGGLKMFLFLLGLEKTKVILGISKVFKGLFCHSIFANGKLSGTNIFTFLTQFLSIHNTII